MSALADRLATVRPSATKAMTYRAAELRETGRDIIVLSQGQPDFDTPQPIAAAGIAAIQAGHTRYTQVAGITQLREAIVEKLSRDNQLQYDPDQVTVACGAKQVIFNALFATLNPGDEVVLPTPCWVSYPDMVHLASGTPVTIDCPESAGFKLRAADLEQAITSKTRWFVLNSPCNPTGAVYSHAELAELAEVLVRHPTVMIMADDIYEKFTYGGARFATMAQVAPQLMDRTLTVNGVSKSYAMTGWRVGYGAGPSDLIAAMNVIQGQTSSHTSSISQHAAVEALTGDESFLTEAAAAYSERRSLVVDALNSAPGLTVSLPDGAFYAFANCGALIGSSTPDGQRIDTDTDLASYLLEHAGVAVVPGSGFLASPFIRVSFAAAVSDLDRGCASIVRACQLLA